MNVPILEQSKHSLATEVLRSWGKLQLRVAGASMLPTLWPGDLLTLRSQNFEQARTGSLVLYVRDGRFIVHRAIRRMITAEGKFLITRGDCLAKEDAPVPAASILATVTHIQRQALVLEPRRGLSLGERTASRLLRRWHRLRNLILRLRMPVDPAEFATWSAP